MHPSELKLRRIGVGGSGLEYCYLRLEKLGDKNLHFYNLLENIKKQDLTPDRRFIASDKNFIFRSQFFHGTTLF